MKLNGWQRLWITTGIFYFFVVMFIFWIIFPRATEIPKCDDPQYPLYGNMFCDLSPTDRDNMPQYQLILKSREATLHNKQIDTIKIAICLWLGPLLLLYVCGLLIRWIYRGFKES